jgi:hypothetical protein
MPMNSPRPRITRRQWTALVSAAPLLGQATSEVPPQGAPAPVPSSATPQQKLQKAYADVGQIRDRLSKIQVPMNVEPAFTFKP